MQCWSEAVHGQSVYAYCSRKRGLTPSARAASFAQEGLRSSGRPRKTASAFSWAMSALACSGELMRPTAAVRVRLSARTAAALRVWYSSSWGIGTTRSEERRVGKEVRGGGGRGE